MNWRAIWAVVRKDDRVIFRYRAILVPMIIVPIIFQVLFPIGFGLAATYAPIKSSDLEDLQQMTRAMPAGIRAEIAGLDERQAFFVLMLVYAFAPMYLIVPLMAASVIAADSFVGEKERKTLEALLHSPITIR